MTETTTILTLRLMSLGSSLDTGRYESARVPVDPLTECPLGWPDASLAPRSAHGWISEATSQRRGGSTGLLARQWAHSTALRAREELAR